MAQFKITITAIGPSGCDRAAKPGDKLYRRCGKLTCPDCLAYDFVQLLKQKGMPVGEATVEHNPGTQASVVDDMLKNERVSGEF